MTAHVRGPGSDVRPLLLPGKEVLLSGLETKSQHPPGETGGCLTSPRSRHLAKSDAVSAVKGSVAVSVGDRSAAETIDRRSDRSCYPPRRQREDDSPGLVLCLSSMSILFAVAVRIRLWGNALALSTVRRGELQGYNYRDINLLYHL